MAAGLIVQDTVTGPMAATLGQGAVVVAPSGDVTMNSSGQFAIEAGAVTAAKIADAVLSGAKAAVVADANVVGGLPVLHRIAVPAGTTGDIDVVLTHKTLVVDVHLVKTAAAGGGAGTIQVKNAGNAITDAMSIDVNDQAVVRAASINDANHEIAAGGTLRVTRTRTASTSEACTVYVLGVRVA